MLSIQVVQAVLKDARMREQAHLIQGEVVRLMEDLSRLDERVRKLHIHFGQAARDIDDILVSSGKVAKRGQKIEALVLPPLITDTRMRFIDNDEFWTRLAELETPTLLFDVVGRNDGVGIALEDRAAQIFAL